MEVAEPLVEVINSLSTKVPLRSFRVRVPMAPAAAKIRGSKRAGVMRTRSSGRQRRIARRHFSLARTIALEGRPVLVILTVPDDDLAPFLRNGLGAAPDATAEALAPAVVAEQAVPAAAVAAGEVVQVQAIVETIDLDNRMVTLKDAEGNVATVPVSDAARNLDQVEIGDEVTFSYLEAVAIELHKTSGAVKGVIESVTGARADKGEKPGASLAREVTMFGVVEAIDSEKPSVTLRGAKGNQVEIQVREPERLEKVAVGDQVQVTYAQAVVISVDAASE